MKTDKAGIHTSDICLSYFFYVIVQKDSCLRHQTIRKKENRICLKKN